MKKINLKLMQGIEEAEGQIENDKGFQDDNDQKVMAVQKQIKHESIQHKNGINKNAQKQVFSFRALLNDINIWKAYATATGQTMERMGAAAMNEYIERHKLLGAEQDIFTALKVRNEKQKR